MSCLRHLWAIKTQVSLHQSALSQRNAQQLRSQVLSFLSPRLPEWGGEKSLGTRLSAQTLQRTKPKYSVIIYSTYRAGGRKNHALFPGLRLLGRSIRWARNHTHPSGCADCSSRVQKHASRTSLLCRRSEIVTQTNRCVTISERLHRKLQSYRLMADSRTGFTPKLKKYTFPTVKQKM